MTGYSFIVPGPPTGKQRPRFVRATGRAFTPKPTVLAESRVLNAWMAAGAQRIESAVKIRIHAVLERPASHYRVNGELTAAGRRAEWPTKKPDADNLCKLVCDALNGHAYRDDAFVVSLAVGKRWALPHEQEHLHVHIAAVDSVSREEWYAA